MVSAVFLGRSSAVCGGFLAEHIPSSYPFQVIFGPRRAEQHLENVDFLLVFIVFLKNSKKEILQPKKWSTDSFSDAPGAVLRSFQRALAASWVAWTRPWRPWRGLRSVFGGFWRRPGRSGGTPGGPGAPRERFYRFFLCFYRFFWRATVSGARSAPRARAPERGRGEVNLSPEAKV